MKTRLYIENYEVELNEDVSFAITKQFTDLSSPTDIINDFSKTLTIPYTNNNDRLFGYIYNPDFIIRGLPENYLNNGKIQGFTLNNNRLTYNQWTNAPIQFYKVVILDSELNEINEYFNDNVLDSYKDIEIDLSEGSYISFELNGNVLIDKVVQIRWNISDFTSIGIQTLYLSFDVKTFSSERLSSSAYRNNIVIDNIGLSNYPNFNPDSKPVYKYFDPTKKLNFRLEHNDSILMEGYVKITSIDSNGYNIVLNGGLGKVFKELQQITFNTSDEESIEEKYKIDGSKYINTQLNKDLVATCWTEGGVVDAPLKSINGEYLPFYNIIGFTPNNSFNEGFDYSSYQYKENLLTQRIFTFLDTFNNNDGELKNEFETNNNVSIDTVLKSGLKPRELAEFRSYLQTPFIYFDRLFEIFREKAEYLTGYKFNLDNNWFNYTNPFYHKLVYTLNSAYVNGKETTTQPEITRSQGDGIIKYGNMDNVDDLRSQQGSSFTLKNLDNTDYNFNPVPQQVKIAGNTIYIKGQCVSSLYNENRIKCLEINPNVGLLVYIVNKNNTYIKQQFYIVNPNCDIENQYWYIDYPHPYVTYQNIAATIRPKGDYIPDVKIYDDDIRNEIINDSNFIIDNTIAATIPDVVYQNSNIGNDFEIYFTLVGDVRGGSGDNFLDRYGTYSYTPFRFTYPNSHFSGNAVRIEEYSPFCSIDLSVGSVDVVKDNEGIIGLEQVKSNVGIYYITNNRSDSLLTLNEMWDNQYNVFGEILKYCKMFNILIEVNEIDKQIVFTQKANYFKNYTVEDWTNRVDYKTFNITPQVADYRYFGFNYKPSELDLLKIYREKYNAEYGEVKYFAEYEFNNDTKDVVNDIAHTTLVSPSLVFWSDLYDKLLLQYSVPEENYILNYDKENKHKSTFGSLFFYNGIKEFDLSLSERIPLITDDTDLMKQKQEYCYSQYAGDYIEMSTYQSLSETLDINGTRFYSTFGIPKELYHFVPYTDLPQRGIYTLIWRRYFQELYDLRNKIIKCRVKFNALDYSKFKWNQFVTIQNRLYFVNKINNFNPTEDFVEVELISVINTLRYTETEYNERIN